VAFDLGRIRTEAQAAPLPSPYPFDLAIAIVNDTFRLAGLAPPDTKKWKQIAPRAKKKLGEEQVGMLAHLLATTSLREGTVSAIDPGRFDAPPALGAFFEAVAPLTAEMIRANAFRQEEFLRRWIEAVGGEIAGESRKESKKRLEQLDYRKTLAEYDRAEKTRQAEAARRAKLLKEAAEREAAARGWRE
jgi:hypothetical protein